VGGLAWPFTIAVMVSDDGAHWTVLGDLVRLSDRHGAPPVGSYETHRFVTDALQARGRYVALVVENTPRTIADEIEVYRGRDEWLNQAPEGKQTTTAPLEYGRSWRVVNGIQSRLSTDLESILEGLRASGLPEAQQSDLQARAEQFRAEIETLDQVPEGFTTVLPLNDPHRRIYALQAPLLRARGLEPLTVWSGYRYDLLQPLDAPRRPPAVLRSLRLSLMRNERRAEVPTDRWR